MAAVDRPGGRSHSAASAERHSAAASSGDGRGHSADAPPPISRSYVASPRNADSRHLPALHGCRSVENYERLNFINEGTYGRVWRAREVQTGTVYALKEVKLSRADSDGFPITTLREINILLSLQQRNIVRVREVVVGSSMDKVYMVMEYCQHDLKSILSRMRQPYSAGEVKSLLQQLLAGVRHLHDNWVLHRDLKTSNLLLTQHGVLKLCDFGLARQFCDPHREYTRTVVTLWYRAPEVLLGERRYTPAIDVWAVGCIFAELLTLSALLPGKSELDQLDRMSKLLGSPSEAIWPGFSRVPNARRVRFAEQPYNYLRQRFARAGAAGSSGAAGGGVPLTQLGYELLNAMLVYDPQRRISASDALAHPYFSEAPLPTDPALIQTFPDEHGGGAQNALHAQPPPPPRAPAALAPLLQYPYV